VSEFERQRRIKSLVHLGTYRFPKLAPGDHLLTLLIPHRWNLGSDRASAHHSAIGHARLRVGWGSMVAKLRRGGGLGP
jgi:hypothetical protein